MRITQLFYGKTILDQNRIDAVNYNAACIPFFNFYKTINQCHTEISNRSCSLRRKPMILQYTEL